MSSPSDDDPYGWFADAPSPGAIGRPPEAVPTPPPALEASVPAQTVPATVAPRLSPYPPPVGEPDPPEPVGAIQPQPTEAERVARRGRWLAWTFVAVVAVVAAGVLYLTGGLETAPAAAPPGLRTASTGEPINVGPATITIQRAVAVLVLNDALPKPTDGYRVLAVVAHVAVTDKQTWKQAYDVLKPIGIAGLGDKTVNPVLMRDSQGAWGLQPGVPEDITWLFEQSLAEPVPSTVTVELWCWQPLDSGDLRVWVDKKPCARVSVPVIDRTAPTPTATAAATPGVTTT